MQAQSQQKLKAGQVICEKCGELCDFKYDRCPACGASLFGNEDENDKTLEPEPPLTGLFVPPELPAELLLTKKDLTRQKSILFVFITIVVIACIFVAISV